MKQIYKSIADIDNGGLQEKMDYELSKIMASINDPNADIKKGATLTVKVKFKPSENKQFLSAVYDVTAKTCPQLPKEIVLLNTKEINNETGEVVPVLKEFNGQAKGQVDWDGNIHEPIEIFYGIGSEKCINKEEIEREEQQND